MLGSIYIGLSGMNAYSLGLQAISDNVANLNSPGFKSSTVGFRDVYSFSGSQSLSYSGARHFGQGVQFGDTRINFAQGDLRASESDLDLALNGAGFFVLLDQGKTLLSRTGQFALDDDGFLADRQTGFRLAILSTGGLPTEIGFDGIRTSEPQATTSVTLDQILSSTSTAANVTGVEIFDSTGLRQVLDIAFTKGSATDPVGTWKVDVKSAAGAVVFSRNVVFTGSSINPADASFLVSFDPEGSEPVSFTLDLAGVDYFSAGSSSTLRLKDADGRAAGSLTGVTIDGDGQVKASYSNDDSMLLGAVAIANVPDLTSLERNGDNTFRVNAGADVRYGASGTAGNATIQSRQTEASNVNLSAEFGDLILIQRGFQASSQVVSVTNEMIQQLFSIRGQG